MLAADRSHRRHDLRSPGSPIRSASASADRFVGFNPRQTRSTIAWQATILAAIGLVGGIPLGIVVGRTSWHLVAESLGIATLTAIPGAALAVLIPLAVVAANGLAFFPARTATRTNPGADLRTE